ncbi:MAG TPA: hypothetical protein VF040_15075 [Ktedonobacterales bacterium]
MQPSMQPFRISTPPSAPASSTPPVSVQGLSGLARGGVPLWLPLPFLISGVIGAALFGALLPWVAPQAILAPGYPHVLALVHTATLGWLTMIIMGASLQLAPVILTSPLRATRFARWHYAVYLPGVALLVTGFWFWRLPLLIAGGSLVVLAVAHYAVILGATLLHARRHTQARPLTARYLTASLIYLCLVVSLGLTAALNLSLGFLGAGTNRLLLAHITLGVVGWLSCTLIGVSYTLVRLFALVHSHNDRLGRMVFALLNGGIVGMAGGFALAWLPLEIAGGLLLVAAVWLFAWDYAQMLRQRKRKLLDATQHHGIAAVGYLAVVVSLGVAAALLGWNSPRLFATLGLAALVGWLGQSTLGYLYKIVPFLIWQSRYGALVGRQKVPLMRDLVRQRWATISFWLVNGALPLVAITALLGWTVPLQVAAAALGGGLILAAANVVGILAPRKVPA